MKRSTESLLINVLGWITVAILAFAVVYAIGWAFSHLIRGPL